MDHIWQKINAHWCWLSIQGAKKRRPKKTTLVLLQLLGGEEERHWLLEIARELKVMCSAWFGMMETHMKHHETISQIEYGNRNFLILDNQHGSSTSGGSSVSGVANGILLWLVSGLLPSAMLRGHAGTLGKWNPCCGSIGWPIANLTLAWRSGARKPKVSHRLPYCLMVIWRIKLVKPPFSDSPTCFCSWNFQHPPSSQFDRKILLANGLDHKIFLASPQGALPKTMAGGCVGWSMYQ